MPSKTSAFTRLFVVTLLLTAPAYSVARAQQNPTPEQFTQDFDYLWSQLRDNYAYFDKKETDWNLVNQIYRPQAAHVRTKREFVTLLEKVLDELYDPHTQLKVNTSSSTRLIPTGLDVWAQFQRDTAVITELRLGFSAEQSGLRVGMEVVAINGVPIETAVRNRMGVALRGITGPARDWALLALLAGAHNVKRVIVARAPHAAQATFQLDLPEQKSVDNYQPARKIESKILSDKFGYIRINDLGSDQTVAEFDSALDRMSTTRGLVLDLRGTQSGGNTSVAEPIMGRLIDRRMAYQKGVPRHGKPWIREVSPRGPWTYKAPVVALVDHWTASMGEGMAIGLDAMKRATIVGTRMAGLNGAVFDLQLPNAGIKLSYAAEKVFHVNGTPRENFVPPVLIRLTGSDSNDEILEAGVRTLKRLVEQRGVQTNRKGGEP